MIVTLAGSAASFAPNDAQLSGINIELAAFDGEIGAGQFPIPDPSATLLVNTGRQLKVVQDFALLSDGFVIDTDSIRGPFRTGTQRELDYSIVDANALLGGFRVHHVRPSETDYARVVAFAAADLPAADTTWVLNSGTLTLPKKTYDSDGGWADLITDVVEFTGKTLFLHDKAGGGRCLHYHALTTGHTSALSISDAVLTNGPTVWNPGNPTRQRTSVDLANDVKGRDQSGRTKTLTDATSITAHDADGLQHQALVDFDARSQADLDAKVAAYLASNKDDRYTYTCTIGPLDGTALGKIRVGDLISVTSDVMALSASTQRIAHMSLTPARPADLWFARLELGAPIRRRSRIKPSLSGVVIAPGIGGINAQGGSGDCGCPPFDGSDCPFQTFDDMNRTNASAWGTTSSAMGTWNGSIVGSSLSGSVLNDSMIPTHGIMRVSNPSALLANVQVEERIVGPGPWSTGDWKIKTSVEVVNTNATAWEIVVGEATVSWARGSGGVLEVTYKATPTLIAMAPGTFDGMGFIDIELRKNGSTVTAIVAGVQISTSAFTPDGPDDDLVFLMSGSTVTLGGAGGGTVNFGPVDYANCSSVPAAGQTFPASATGDGSTTVYTAPYPFRAVRSVSVAGVDVTADVTGSDIDANGSFTTYTFAHAPRTGATIRVVLEGVGL